MVLYPRGSCAAGLGASGVRRARGPRASGYRVRPGADELVMGHRNHYYRGGVDRCQIIPIFRTDYPHPTVLDCEARRGL